jgi:hypothetical protein
VKSEPHDFTAWRSPALAIAQDASDVIEKPVGRFARRFVCLSSSAKERGRSDRP